jgi:hypothetical protein
MSLPALLADLRRPVARLLREGIQMIPRDARSISVFGK